MIDHPSSRDATTSSTTTMPHELRVHFRNANDDRNRPLMLDQYAPSARFKNIVSCPNINVFALSEIMVNSIPLLTQLLSNEYNCMFMSYAPSQPDRSHYHFIAVKRTITMPSIHMRWFTSTPTVPLDMQSRKLDPLLQSYNVEYEKGVMMAHFKQLNILLVIVHYPLYRYQQSNQYADKCSEMLLEWCVEFESQYPGLTVVAGCDFNVFHCSTHMNILYDRYWDLTPKVQTFACYPWDVGLGRTQQQAQQVITAKKQLAACVDAASYVAQYKRSMKLIWNGPLKGRLDRILSNRMLDVLTVDNFDALTLDDYSTTPFAPSDHIGFIIVVK